VVLFKVMDVSIFQVLNGLAGQSVVAIWLSVFFAEYLPYLILAVAFVLVWLWRKEWTEKIRIIITFIITAAVAYGIIYLVFHPLWPRLRPFEVLSGVMQLVPESGLSFPSKHAVMFFLLATFVWSFNKKIGYWFFAAAFLISLGRVLVGVHYPLDVLAGTVFGILMGWVGILILKKFRNP